MQESATCFHHIEWPGPGGHVAGPIVWLRGWVVGKPGYDFTDIKIISAGGIHQGVLGLPREDLAVHFKSARRWLPAEFVVAVPAPIAGRMEYVIEAMDEYGNWHRLRTLAIQIAPDGEKNLRSEGEVIKQAGGSSTLRTPHLPFHGHLDAPEKSMAARHGRVAVFGWLLHETQTIRSVCATVDGLVFNTLESGLTDESLAVKLPQHKSARHARLRGEVDVPPTIAGPACLRIYAELADGTVALCFAQRLQLEAISGGPTLSPPADHPDSPSRPLSPPHPAATFAAGPAVPPYHYTVSTLPRKTLVDLPSGRPRRLLIAAKTLQPDEATLRAMDVARHLIASNRWAVRLVVAEDGPLRESFEAASCAVQIVDPAAYFAAKDEAATERALAILARQIWWRHLDAVAIFDPSSVWAEQLARQKKLPVLPDPIDELLWFSPEPAFSVDAQASIYAPIRGLSIHGAGVMLHAADQLSRRHIKLVGDRKLILTDVRDTVDERLFKADLSSSTATTLAAGSSFEATAAVVCPVFDNHPHRALLSAAVACVPLITTSSPALATVFGTNEVQYVPRGNPLALAHAIADLLANPSSSARRAEAAARITEAHFHPARQLACWQELLESVVAG